MIRLTNLADYAVVLMCEIALSDSRLSAQDLAKRTRLPLPTVSKILNALSHGQLLESRRGLKGGFSIAKSTDEISVADVIEAIDGPIALTTCAESSGTKECSFDDICLMRPRWQVINRSLRLALDNVKLSSLLAPIEDDTLRELLREGSEADKVAADDRTLV